MGRPDRSRYFTLAHQYVSVAVYNGDLPKLDGSVLCADCSMPAEEYDHRDYKKPMEVAPVCRACNAARGPGLHRDPAETGVKPLSIRKRFDAGFRGGDYRKAKRLTTVSRHDLRPDIFGPAPKGGEGGHAL